MLSTDAVTTILLQCFCPAMADTTSIQCIKRPPMRLLSVFVSLGSTSSVILTYDSWGDFFLRDIDLKFQGKNMQTNCRLKLEVILIYSLNDRIKLKELLYFSSWQNNPAPNYLRPELAQLGFAERWEGFLLFHERQASSSLPCAGSLV